MSDPEQPEDETKKKPLLASDELASADASPASDAGSESKVDADADADPDAEADEEARQERRRKRREARAREPRQPSGVTPSRVAIFALAALAAGAAAGWFGQVAYAKQKLRADSAPAAAGSGAAKGPCATWEKKLCESGGEESALCQQAKAATGILVPSTCAVALEAVPATLAKVKLERAPCEQLVTKLCADLPPGSGACTMVKEKTPAFPSARCSEMLGNYAEVLEGVKQIDKQLAGQPPPQPGQPRMGMPGNAPGAPGNAPGAPHP
jgi:hypothetical protein